MFDTSSTACPGPLVKSTRHPSGPVCGNTERTTQARAAPGQGMNRRIVV
jgi:hypothetical protein